MKRRIHLVRNTVRISKRTEQELNWFHESTDYDGVVPCLDEDGYLYFYLDSPASDYVANVEVQKFLKKHKVKGDICFVSDDGKKETGWGYRFDGKGGMKKLEGKVTFLVAKK